MDPISHVVFGQTLVTALRDDRSSRRATTIAAIAGALAPDVDAVLMPAGWDIYLRAHEIGTHSVAGIIPLACAVALVVGMFARRSRFLDLYLAAAIGCGSHIALDLLSGARIQIGWPVIAGRFGLPLVAMAEPWLIAGFVGAAVALLLARRQPRRMAAAVLGLLLLFFVVKATLLLGALRTLGPATDHAALARIVEARWASLTEWYVFDRTADRLKQWTITPDRPPTLVLSWPIPSDTPMIDRSRSLSTVRNFLAVHELAFAEQGLDPDSDRATRVFWSDLRFCWPSGTGDGAANPALAPAPAVAAPRIACGLWVGGVFDSDGLATREMVKIGGWWQTRAPSPPPRP